MNALSITELDEEQRQDAYKKYQNCYTTLRKIKIQDKEFNNKAED
jgi:hypothetical protein